MADADIALDPVEPAERLPDCGGTYGWRARFRDFYHQCRVPSIVVAKGPESERITCIDGSMNG